MKLPAGGSAMQAIQAVQQEQLPPPLGQPPKEGRYRSRCHEPLRGPRQLAVFGRAQQSWQEREAAIASNWVKQPPKTLSVRDGRAMNDFAAGYAGYPSNQQRTFGVEEEFLLIDEVTLRPVAVAQASLAGAALTNEAASGLSLELKEEQLEAISPVCSTLDELRTSIAQGRSRADEAARLTRARAIALATSVEASSTHTVPLPRYLAMAARFGLTLKEQLTCGMHIHVGVESADEGVGVLDRIRVWLPVLLALSANSPYWHGQDSGYESFRYQAWNRWPSAGPYDIFGSAEAYRSRIRSLAATGVLLDEDMIYFDARLSSHHPTVEVRVTDVCLEAAHAAALAGIVRALVETAAQHWKAGVPAPEISTAQLRLASWQASRYGIDGNLIHPALQRPCAAIEAVQALLTHVRPALERSGDAAAVTREIGYILQRGNGSRRQRENMMSFSDSEAVVADAIERTHSASGPPAEERFLAQGPDRGRVRMQRSPAPMRRPLRPTDPFPQPLEALSNRDIEDLQSRVNEELFRECNAQSAPDPITLSRFWQVSDEMTARAEAPSRKDLSGIAAGRPRGS